MQSPIEQSQSMLSSSEHEVQEQPQFCLEQLGFLEENVKDKIVESSPKERFYRFNDEIGFGSYKSVYKAYDSDTGKQVAWNVIKLMKLPQQERKRLTEEISILKNINHRRIINFINAWLNKLKNEMIFITEMVSGGSLKKHLRRVKKPRLKIIKGWCKQILEGLEYLHSQSPPIIHRDIKCQNIFINSNTNQIRIGDLGLAISTRNSYAQTLIGTPQFMAPQIFQGKYGTSVDIYAFGMCVLQMVTHQTPYQQCDSLPTIYKYIERRIKPRSLNLIESQTLRKFILRCFSESKDRPTASQLLLDQFLNENLEQDNKQIQIKQNMGIIPQVPYQYQSTLISLEKKIDENQNLFEYDEVQKSQDGFSSHKIFETKNQNEYSVQRQKQVLFQCQSLFKKMYQQYRHKILQKFPTAQKDLIQKIITIQNQVLHSLHTQQQLLRQKNANEERRHQIRKLQTKKQQQMKKLQQLEKQQQKQKQELVLSSQSSQRPQKSVKQAINPVQQLLHKSSDKIQVSLKHKSSNHVKTQNPTPVASSCNQPQNKQKKQIQITHFFEMKSQQIKLDNRSKQTGDKNQGENVTNSNVDYEIFKNKTKGTRSDINSNHRRGSMQDKLQYQNRKETTQIFFDDPSNRIPISQNIAVSLIDKNSFDSKMMYNNIDNNKIMERKIQKVVVQRPISSRPLRNQQKLSSNLIPQKQPQFHRTNTHRSQKSNAFKNQQDIVLLMKAKKISSVFPIAKQSTQKPAISLIQNILNRLLDQKIQTLGIFGHYTQQIIKRYQTSNKLHPSGIVDEQLFTLMVNQFQKSISYIKQQQRQMKQKIDKQTQIRKQKDIQAQKILSQLQNQILKQE